MSSKSSATSLLSSGTPPREDEKQRTCRGGKCGVFCIVLGMLLIVLGTLYATVVPKTLDNKLVASFCFKEDLEPNFNNFHGDCPTCVPMYVSYHPFHLENAGQVYLDPSVKLDVLERGPYVYRKTVHKQNVVVEDDTISYRSYAFFVYQPEASCSSCTERDMITTLDMGYLGIMTRAGGEAAFLDTVLTSLVGTGTVRSILDRTPNFSSNFLKMLYGINSMEASAMKTSSDLLAGLSDTNSFRKMLAVRNLARAQLEGLAYSGMFTTMPVRALARTTPSILAGMAVTALGQQQCADVQVATRTDAGAFCTACASSADPSEACRDLSALCGVCLQAKMVHHLSSTGLCPAMRAQLLQSTQDATLTDNIIAQTCGQCGRDFASAQFCIAPLPGAVTGGIDYGDSPPVESEMVLTKQYTGCTDAAMEGEYILYNGVSANPLWDSNQDPTVFPTTAQLTAFQDVASCDAERPSNVICSPIAGVDGSRFPPGGADLNGFAEEATVLTRDIYMSSAKQKMTMVLDPTTPSTLHGIPLNRYRLREDELSPTAENAQFGTGRPFAGIQSLAFNIGFLAVLSFPYYIYGDHSLLSGVNMKFGNGQPVNINALYEGTTLRPEMLDKYGTYVDVEPASGRTLLARKRLMASFALTRTNEGRVISDVTSPSMPAEILIPIQWSGGAITLPETLGSQVHTFVVLGNTIKPAFIGLLIIGSLFLLRGFFLCITRRRRSSPEQA